LQIQSLHFSSTQISFVGALFFLRFVCPVVCFSKDFGYDFDTTKEGQKNLILISKILQLISQNGTFSEDSPYVSLNEFLQEKSSFINNFFQAMTDPSNTTPLLTITISEEERDWAYEYIRSNVSRVITIMDEKEKKTENEKKQELKKEDTEIEIEIEKISE